MLKDGGLYLNHGIDHEFHWKRTSQTEFLYRYVFPNGDLAGLTETITEMERARLGDHGRRGPAPALRAHLPALGRAAARARGRGARASSASVTYRTWLLYLTCSAVAFEAGSIGLYQVLMRKQWDPRVGYAPRTREPLYERAPA